MTPKEKAEDILDKCYGVEVESVYFGVNHYLAKKFALIVVDEILDVDCFDMSEEHFDNHIEFWEEVKQEIENYENTN
jgi:hypothetical protein